MLTGPCAASLPEDQLISLLYPCFQYSRVSCLIEVDTGPREAEELLSECKFSTTPTPPGPVFSAFAPIDGMCTLIPTHTHTTLVYTQLHPHSHRTHSHTHSHHNTHTHTHACTHIHKLTPSLSHIHSDIHSHSLAYTVPETNTHTHTYTHTQGRKFSG